MKSKNYLIIHSHWLIYKKEIKETLILVEKVKVEMVEI